MEPNQDIMIDQQDGANGWLGNAPLAAMSLGLSGSHPSPALTRRASAIMKACNISATPHGRTTPARIPRGSQASQHPINTSSTKHKPAHQGTQQHSQHDLGKLLNAAVMVAGGMRLMRLVVGQLRQAWLPHREPKATDKAKAGLVWFRNDLRLADHEALVTALKQCETVIPVYCFAPHDFSRQGAVPSTSTCVSKVQHTACTLDSLRDLAAQLQALGSHLVVRCGRPEHVLPQLAALLGAKHVYCHQEVTRDEQQCEARVAAALRKAGVGLQAVWGSSTLHHLDDLPFTPGQMALDYNAFQKRVDSVTIRQPLPAPDSLGPWPAQLNLRPGRFPVLDTLGLDSPSVAPSQGGETAALQHLQQLSAQPEQTPQQHTAVATADAITRWLATGSLSPRQVHHALSSSEDKRLHWLKFELMWRDFFRLMTCKFNAALPSSGSSDVPAGHPTAAGCL